jgi:hypothetical protein
MGTKASNPESPPSAMEMWQTFHLCPGVSCAIGSFVVSFLARYYFVDHINKDEVSKAYKTCGIHGKNN